MRTTGQRLDEHHDAIQRMLNWWGELLPALLAVEDRLNELSARTGDPELAEELHALRDLLARASGDAPR